MNKRSQISIILFLFIATLLVVAFLLCLSKQINAGAGTGISIGAIAITAIVTLLAVLQQHVYSVFFKRVGTYVAQWRAEGKRPANHDVEKAARDAFKDSLLTFAQEFSASMDGSSTPGIDALRDALRMLRNDAEPSPWNEWPDFRFLEAPETFRALWGTDAPPFSNADLEDVARQWLAVFPAVPAHMRDAANRLPGLWSEHFRQNIKHNQPAATAHSFAFLAALSSPPSIAPASPRKRHSPKQRAGDEALVRQIKNAMPVAPDMRSFLNALETTSLHERRKTWRAMVAVLVFFCALAGGGIWWLDLQTANRFVQNENIMGEIIDAENFLERQERISGIARPPVEIRDHALRIVAKRKGVTPEQLRNSLDDMIARTRENPDTGALIKSQAALLEGRIEDAKREAMLAVQEAEADKEADDSKSTLARISDAYKQLGLSFEAAGKYDEAVAAYHKVLDTISQINAPEQRMALQALLSNAVSRLPSRRTDDNEHKRRNETIQNYRAVLTGRTREAFPKEWAEAQRHLGDALSNQANASRGIERAELLTNAVAAYCEALKEYAPEAFPEDWAETQCDLGKALTYQADAVEGSVAEAIAALPQDWGNPWAVARRKANAARNNLLSAAVSAYSSALTVYTREAFPQDWAETQYNLGTVLHRQANASDGAERTNSLAAAVATYNAALAVRTREAFPQDWAATQYNLGLALRDQTTEKEDGPEKIRLLNEAVAAFDNALEIYAKQDFPVQNKNIQEELKSARKRLSKLEK
jgi:Tetratricopeptide repeat.